VAAVVGATGAAPPVSAATPSTHAPLFNNLGNFSRPISTKSPAAQRYFDQGLILAYGFNHAEAGRSFREASRLDPTCAICRWGEALVLGPNINLPMMDGEVPEAFQASRAAESLKEHASPVEQALIGALVARYADKPSQDRSALDREYADAMRSVAQRFPNDADVQTLFAEALLDLSPWNYWNADGTPRNAASEIVATLEHAIRIAPTHPGALHLYIHALEASSNPGRAEAAADRLRGLVPGAGHLVHMPAHIYLRIGRYHDAVQVNLLAAKADAFYIAQCHVQGFYPLAYHPHNWHFIWASASFEGNRAQAIAAAEKTAHLMHGHAADDPLFGAAIEHFMLTPAYVSVRFAQWDTLLAMPAPRADLLYPSAMWHAAHGMALAARGREREAAQDLAAVREIERNPQLAAVIVSPRNNAAQLVAIAEHLLAGDIAARGQRYGEAVARLNEAADLEWALGYDEPADWYYPIREYLGAILLEAGRAQDAERAYREDLGRNPENGWSLYGLAQSLRAQGRNEEAAAVEQRFQRAWRYADVKLTSSVLR
jgi:tetratricopeptide (TPR) repeat protein